VSYEEGKQFADSLGLKFIETSAKNASNVTDVFFTLAKEIKNSKPNYVQPRQN